MQSAYLIFGLAKVLDVEKAFLVHIEHLWLIVIDREIKDIGASRNFLFR